MIRAGHVHLSVVWTDMLEGDDPDSAWRASKDVPALPQAIHYHDPDRAIGKLVAEGIGARGKIAWDFYLVYAREVEWGRRAPDPTGWCHQLQQDDWAGPERFRWGDDLGPAVRAQLNLALGLSQA